jgi:hypothetical protein
MRVNLVNKSEILRNRVLKIVQFGHKNKIQQFETKFYFRKQDLFGTILQIHVILLQAIDTENKPNPNYV